MKQFTTLVVLFLLCVTAYAEDKVVLLRETLGIDADRSLGCKRGVAPTFTSGDNSTRLEAALGSTTGRYPVFLPGGDWELPSTLDFPALYGAGSLYGAGGLSSDLGENHFSGPVLGSSQVSRLIWKGSDNGTMLKLPTTGSTLTGLFIQGCRVTGGGPEPTGGTYPNRAKVGLHLFTSDGGTNTSKCHLSHLGFWQCHTGILIGYDLVDADVGDADYPGDDASHADTVYAEDLHFIHPASGAHSGFGSCVHIRNDQSVSNYFNSIQSRGNPAQAFYLERGGKTHVGLISTSGSAVAVRVGMIDAASGGMTVDRVSIDGGTTGKMLKGDFHTVSLINAGRVEIRSGDIPESVSTVPQIDVTPGIWIIRNTGYLRAGSIKLRGDASDNLAITDRPCIVYLDGCTTYACTMAN